MASPSAPSRVTLFATCLADRFFAEACGDTVRVMRHFGVAVDVPTDQTCCGQPAYNTGHKREAERMARHTTRVLAGEDPVVVPSGSCAGMIRSFYAGLVPERPDGDDLPGRTWELAQFLVRELRVLERNPDGPEKPLGDGLSGLKIAYHHGCHALRELGVHDEPVDLLRACGAEVVAWPGDVECCGFGGLFSSKFPEVSAGMADRKLDALTPEVDFVTSADGGCLLQLSGRARHTHAAGPVFVHLATLLRRGIGA
jgi:L-lactate dehydrogenase complex protein LldE